MVMITAGASHTVELRELFHVSAHYLLASILLIPIFRNGNLAILMKKKYIKSCLHTQYVTQKIKK